jgi:hypothetical protein
MGHKFQSPVIKHSMIRHKGTAGTEGGMAIFVDLHSDDNLFMAGFAARDDAYSLALSLHSRAVKRWVTLLLCTAMLIALRLPVRTHSLRARVTAV